MTRKKKAAKRLSLRGAIDEMCKACIYDPRAAGSWRAQTEACTAPKCPLYRARPRTTGGKK